MAVVATAGTTSTGTVDPLAEVAEVCAEERGLDARRRGLRRPGGAGRRPAAAAGRDRARRLDRVDPHKWLYIAQSAGCVLVRDPQHLVDCLPGAHTSYVSAGHGAHRRRGQPGASWAAVSRGASRALKLWVSLPRTASGPTAPASSHEPRWRATWRHACRSATGSSWPRPAGSRSAASATCRSRVDAGVPVTAERADPSELQLDGRVYTRTRVLGERSCCGRASSTCAPRPTTLTPCSTWWPSWRAPRPELRGD